MGLVILFQNCRIDSILMILLQDVFIRENNVGCLRLVISELIKILLRCLGVIDIKIKMTEAFQPANWFGSIILVYHRRTECLRGTRFWENHDIISPINIYQLPDSSAA